MMTIIIVTLSITVVVIRIYNHNHHHHHHHHHDYDEKPRGTSPCRDFLRFENVGEPVLTYYVIIPILAVCYCYVYAEVHTYPVPKNPFDI